MREGVREKNSRTYKEGKVDAGSMVERGVQLTEEEGTRERCSAAMVWSLWCRFSGGSDTRRMERRKRVRCLFEGLGLGACIARW